MTAGFFITDKSIKIAKLTGKKPTLVKVPLEDGILEEGVVKDEKKFGAILGKIAHEAGLEKKEVVLSISERYIFTKAIKVSAKEDDSEEKIKEELESYLPLPLGQSATDWQILEEAEGGKKILIASAPANLLDAYINLLKAASITVVGVEPLAFALARKMSTAKKPKPEAGAGEQPPQASLIAVFEEDEVLLTILDENSNLELTSVLPQAVLTQRNELLSEISEMRSFYEKKNPEKKVGKLFITGEGITDELKDQIASHLSLEAELLRINSSAISVSDSLSFLAVFSLIDLPVSCPKDHHHINLLPEQLIVLHKNSKGTSYIKRLLTISSFTLTVFCFLYLGILAYFFWQLQSLDKEIAKQKAFFSGNLAGVKQHVLNVNKEVDIVKMVGTKNDHLFDALSFLSSKTPGGIVIKNYKIDLLQNAVSVAGLSLEREKLLEFKQILETDGKFKDIKIPLSDLEKKGATTFSLSFTEGSK